jgi:ketosteroid isomerase-like protein
VGLAAAPHGEVVTVRDGKIVEILVYASPDVAITAAATAG